MIIFKNETLRFEHTCSMIWFHTESHAALEVDKTLYNLFFKCVESESANYSAKRDKALKGHGRPYYQFHLGITSEEKELLKKEWQQLGFHTCSGNAARLLTKVTGIALPQLSWVPAYYAEHLYTTREQLDSRIVCIEYLGNDNHQDISKTIERGKWDEWGKYSHSVTFLLFIICFGYLEYLLKNS